MQSALGNCRSHLCRYGGQMCACMYVGFPGGASKEPACHCRRHNRYMFHPWVGTSPWRRAWQPTAVFLSGEPHGQRSLAGYSPWGQTWPRQLSTMPLCVWVYVNSACATLYCFLVSYLIPPIGSYIPMFRGLLGIQWALSNYNLSEWISEWMNEQIALFK